MRYFSLLNKINAIILTQIIILVFLVGNINITGQQSPKYQLEDIIVTASRIPLNSSDLTRSLEIISKDEIKKAPVSSVQDLLKYVAGIDLKRRGVDGVQGDISIRGGSSEQTLIMIDGVKVSDPQTSHHNLNLPISLYDIERIEILKGQGSHIYGPNAFSGIVNIITKKGSEKSLSLEAAGGQYNYYDYSLGFSYPIENFSNHLSFSRQKSDGYIHNTDFGIMNFSYKSSYRIKSGVMNLFFGYNDKKFGANSFYTDLFPNQWEHTTTKFFNLSADIGTTTFTISPKVYWRRNDDDYVLDYQNPSFYENIHQSNTYGAEIQSTITTEIGTAAVGGEFVNHKLTSTNLGDHSQNRSGIFAELNFSPLKNLAVILGGFAYNYSEIGWKLWPGLDVAYKFTEKLKVYGSIGKAFRIPSYTELFYQSPTVVGNPGLKPEETLNYEAGVKFSSEAFAAGGSLFRNEGKNIIDYTRLDGTQPWMARNIAEVNTTGFEINLTLNPSVLIAGFPIDRINAGYTYINSDKKTANFNSLYVLDYLKNQLVVNVDAQIFRTFDQFEIFIKATNLFNKAYHEIGGVLLPGRWLKAGVQFNLFN
jgi:vitamin B12 transporter